MKISPYSYSYSYSAKNRPVSAPQFSHKQQPVHDTLSFKGDFQRDYNPGKIQLYRSISEAEYKNLLKGEVMNKGYNYATSDPRGWGASDWNSGYVFNRREPVYFVTFKPDADLGISDRRDEQVDTRYGIEPYTLKDVKNIRKGSNIHGELVYSENFESDRLDDKLEKIRTIARCKNTILYNKDPKAQETAWDMLTSYAEEFPDIIDFECDYTNQTAVNGMLSYLNKAKNPEYLNIARKCIQAQIENPEMKIINNAAYFLGEKGDVSDVALIVELTKANKLSPYSAACDLNKLIKDDSMDDYIIKEFKNNDGKNLKTLVEFFSLKNKDNKYNYIFRDVLKNNMPYVTPKDSFDYFPSLIIETCAKELAEEPLEENIECLKPYYSQESPNSYPSYEVSLAILKIENKITARSLNK